MLATGHYIQRRAGPPARSSTAPAMPSATRAIFCSPPRGRSSHRLLFPLGACRKAEVRALARKFDLPVADKSDSQDICFVPQGRYTSIIERLKPGAAEAGDIVHVDGRSARSPRRHHQLHDRPAPRPRHPGPGAALRRAPRCRQAKQVVVGPRESLHAHWIALRNVNWLGDEPIPDGWARVAVRDALERAAAARHLFPCGRRCAGAAARWRIWGCRGQACVFYADAGPRGAGARAADGSSAP